MVGKRMAALLLAMGMVVATVAGCGSTESASSGSSTGSDASAGDDGTEVSDDADAEDEDDDDEITEITVALMAMSPIDTADSDAVMDALNEMTERDINVHVNLQWYDAGTYGTTVPMMIQGGDTLDLMMYTPVPSASFSSFLSAGQLMDISDLLDEYGQGIKEVLGERIHGTELNGAIYGVGNNLAGGGDEKMLIRKDVLDEVGRTEDAENAASWSEIEDIMKDVCAKGYTGFINSDAQGGVLFAKGLNGEDSFADNRDIDTIGDGNLLVQADDETDEVQCVYFTDDFTKEMERVATWYQEGLIYKDAATAQDYGDTLLKNGTGVAKVVQGDIATQKTVEGATGYEYVEVKVHSIMITTSTSTKFGYGIPVTAKEPEAAMKYLNYIFTSEEAMNLLTWGIEGRDYVIGDDGYATYPDGVDADSVQYHTGDFLYGNTRLVVPWTGAVVSREEQFAESEKAEISKYYGFMIDNTDLENTVTACTNVVNQYYATLLSGTAGANWESTLQKFRDALTQAGINDLVAAYQTQLDNWLADNQ